MKKRTKTIQARCSTCKQLARLDLTERSVLGMPGVVETGTTCARCGTFRRAAFDSAALKARRAKLQQTKGRGRKLLQAQYTAAFDKFQAEMKARLTAAQPAPGGSIASETKVE